MGTKRKLILTGVLSLVFALTVIGLIAWRKSGAVLAETIGENKKHEEGKKTENKTPEGPPNPKGLNRGLENNNPGNIRISSQAWKGKIPKSQNTDGSFEQFTESFWGVRAMIKIVKGWVEKNKATTIEQIVHKYAPSKENDSASYIQFLVEKTGIPHDKKINADQLTMKSLILSMGQMESGKGSINDVEFDQAWKNLA